MRLRCLACSEVLSGSTAAELLEREWSHRQSCARFFGVVVQREQR